MIKNMVMFWEFSFLYSCSDHYDRQYDGDEWDESSLLTIEIRMYSRYL